MRVTTHPSQFVVLSSLNPNVIKNSIEQLKHHAWIFDKMGLDESPYYLINIHGAGVTKKKYYVLPLINYQIIFVND